MNGDNKDQLKLPFKSSQEQSQVRDWKGGRERICGQEDYLAMDQ